jgi:hypothetical protein
VSQHPQHFPAAHPSGRHEERRAAATTELSGCAPGPDKSPYAKTLHGTAQLAGCNAPRQCWGCTARTCASPLPCSSGRTCVDPGLGTVASHATAARRHDNTRLYSLPAPLAWWLCTCTSRCCPRQSLGEHEQRCMCHMLAVLP